MLLIVLFFSLSLTNAENITQNSTNETLENVSSLNLPTVAPLPELEILRIIPQEVKVGDVQLIIEVKNNKNETISGLTAIVSGNGFSTYDVIASDAIEENQKDYIIVQSNFQKVGNITLTIKMNNAIYYYNMSVIGQDTLVQQQIAQQEEIAKKEILTNLSQQVEVLKEKYDELEANLTDKKENHFDVSKINLDDLKKYIRTAETNWLQEDITSTRISLRLAEEEYEYQSTRLGSVKEIPLLQRLKDNALLFSAIAGALITFFALSELLRKKSEHVVVKITNIKKEKQKNGKDHKDKRKRV